MRLLAITVLLAALLNITNACLIIQGSGRGGQSFTVNLYDNNKGVCTWSGNYISGQLQFLFCISGFASWIRLTNRVGNGPTALVAYANSGNNYRFDVPAISQCSQPFPDSCQLDSFGGRYFGCPAARAIQEPIPGVAKSGDIVGTVGGWVQEAQVSTTANVMVGGGKTAGVARATVF